MYTTPEMFFCITIVFWVLSLPALWLGDPGQQFALVMIIPVFDIPVSGLDPCEAPPFQPELVELDSVQLTCVGP